MAVVVELSGEQLALAHAETEAAAAVLSAGRARTVAAEDGVVVLEGPGVTAEALAARLGLAHDVLNHWASTPLDVAAVIVACRDHDLGGASFAVRGRRLHGLAADFPLSELERGLGAALAPTGRVDLANPAVDVRVLLGQRAFAGVVAARVDRSALEARAVKHRPLALPVSIHPKFARALVNLALVRPGDVVADPFSGTGGLLLEAGLLGALVLASDFDARMVAGTRDTLAAFDVTPLAAETRDVGELPEFAAAHGVSAHGLDAVLADPPYARSSTTNLEDLDALYERFFAAANEALKSGGRVVSVFPGERHVDAATKWFDLVHHFELRVHRSMTRHFTVLQKA